MSAEAQASLGYKQQAIVVGLDILKFPRFGQEDNAQLRQIDFGNGELDEVILGVVAENVNGRVEEVGGVSVYGQVPHNHLDRRFDFFGPLGRRLLVGTRAQRFEG